MARPRKNSKTPETRRRIIDAFWVLLEDYNVGAITVDMVIDRAGCNRGSFYYHYTDIVDLADAALDSLLTSEENVPGRIFVLTTGASSVPDVFGDRQNSVRLLSLALRRGGYDTVESRLLDYIEGIWTGVICDEGETLTDESRFVITYTVGAILGVIERYGEDVTNSSALEVLFVSEACGVSLRNLCTAQGMTFDEVLERLRGLKRIERMESTHKSRRKTGNLNSNK